LRKELLKYLFVHKNKRGVKLKFLLKEKKEFRIFFVEGNASLF